MTAAVAMIDATRLSAGHIPGSAPKVAGYVSGTADVEWSAADWARFPQAGHVRIEQGFGPFDAITCDVLDVEAGAITPARAVDGVKARIGHGIGWTTIYATGSSLAAVAGALQAAGPHGWYAGHVDCWLADWNLDEDQAASLLGSEVHGLTVRAVQWASPSSNPRTLMPGSALSLAEANTDLSVSQADWHAGPVTHPKPPEPVHVAELEGVLVVLPGGTSRKVLSHDGGKSWE